MIRNTSTGRLVGTGIAALALVALSSAWANADEPGAMIPAATATTAPSVSPDSGAERNPLKVTFTNTFRYTLGYRLGQRNPLLSSDATSPNANDADNAFAPNHFMRERFDLLSELDVAGKNYGFRLSGEYWFDSVYQANNANFNAIGTNWQSVPPNQFTSAAVNLEGNGARWLDAFAYLNGDLGKTPTTTRIGQYAQVWGESLFFGGNAVAGGMSAVDIDKALGDPAAQFKEIVLPTLQVGTQLQLAPRFALSAYYQLKFRKNILPAVGSYFSPIDLADEGAERIFAGPTLGMNGAPIVLPNGNPLYSYIYRVADQYPPNNGQYGVRLTFRTSDGTGLGAYFVAFHDKSGQPTTYVGVGGSPVPTLGPISNFPTYSAQSIGTYNFIYPQNIRIYGLSASKSLGDFSLAAEASYRVNQDLSSVPVNTTTVVGLVPPPGAPPGTPGVIPVFGNGGCFGLGSLPAAHASAANPCYAVGSTLHGDFNFLYTVPRNFISKESSLALEIGYQHLAGVTQNQVALNPYVTRNVSAFVVQYTPTYRNVGIAGMDLDVPITWSQGIQGIAPVSGTLNSGGVGTINVALVGVYKQSFTTRLSYTHYIGPAVPTLSPISVPPPVGSGPQAAGGQNFADRNWISLTFGTTF